MLHNVNQFFLSNKTFIFNIIVITNARLPLHLYLVFYCVPDDGHFLIIILILLVLVLLLKREFVSDWKN
jgi:hypothetical protein